MGNGLSNGATGWVGTTACSIGSTTCTTPVNGWTYAAGSPAGVYTVSAQAALDQSKAGSFACSTTSWNPDYVSCSCTSGSCPTIGSTNTSTTPMYCQASTSTTGPFSCSAALPPKKTSPWVIAGIVLAIFIVIVIIIVIIIAMGRKKETGEKAVVVKETKEE